MGISFKQPVENIAAAKKILEILIKNMHNSTEKMKILKDPNSQTAKMQIQEQEIQVKKINYLIESDSFTSMTSMVETAEGQGKRDSTLTDRLWS